MGWTKLGVLTLLLFIIFSVSMFGNHFGYTVDGVPHGGQQYLEYESRHWSEAEYGLDVVTEYWTELRWAKRQLGTGNAFTFFVDMVTFQVDGVPVELGVVFIMMSLVTLFIAISMFLPGGGG